MVAMVRVLSWGLSPLWLPDVEDDGSLLVGPPQALNTMQRQSNAEIRENSFFFMVIFLSLNIIWIQCGQLPARIPLGLIRESDWICDMLSAGRG